MTDNALLWSYAFYIVCFETLVLGGTGYAVFVLHESGWWFALAVIVSGACFKPHHWKSIVTGEKPHDLVRASENPTP